MILVHAIGLLFATILACTWPAIVLLEDPSIARGWWEQSIGRFAEHWGEQTRPWYYYFYQVPALLGPAFLLALIGVLRRPSPLLLAWFGVTFILLSLSEGKRDHYILPALLPCSVWAGLGWEYLWQHFPNRRMHLSIGMMMAGVILIASAASLKMLPGQNDPMSTLQKMAQRDRLVIRQARSIAQIGSNNHASAFILDRPMRWYPDIDRWREDGSFGDLVLTMNRPSLEVPTSWRLIDQEKSSDGKVSFQLYEPFAPPSATKPD